MKMYAIVMVSKVLFPTGLCVLEQGLVRYIKNSLLILSILDFKLKTNS